jgi:ribosomal protein S27AE
MARSCIESKRRTEKWKSTPVLRMGRPTRPAAASGGRLYQTKEEQPMTIIDYDERCPRCGAHMQMTHHPLCQERDGTPTGLTDEQIRAAIKLLADEKVRAAIERYLLKESRARAADVAVFSWLYPHDPKRSDEELIEILASHRSDLLPFTPEEIQEWLDHVKACGGYENTAFGGKVGAAEEATGF